MIDLSYLDDLFKPTGRSLRDEGMALVDEHESEAWKDRARAMVRKLVTPGWVGLAEEIRFRLLDAGLDRPHSPNCWGSLTMWLIRNGYLEPLDQHRHPSDPKSHACKKQLLARTALR